MTQNDKPFHLPPPTVCTSHCMASLQLMTRTLWLSRTIEGFGALVAGKEAPHGEDCAFLGRCWLRGLIAPCGSRRG